jgi:glycosyltransferase involved in cell wall biosynthesis
VVVNDGGTNVRLALEGLHDERIKCFDKQHAGYPAAANLGLSIARGEYVSYLGDDDRWYPNHLATCVDVLDRDHNIGLVYTKQLRRSFVWRERQRVIVEDYLEPLSEFNWAKLLDVNWIPMTSVVHRSQLIEQCGPFKDLPILEDWELLLRLCSITQVAHIPIVTGEYYFDPTGESRNEKMKKENPKKSRKIIEDIRNSHRSRDVREAERPPDYFPERFVLSTLFAGQGSIGVALRMASNLYLYSRYWGRKAAFKKMWRRLLQSFQKN